MVQFKVIFKNILLTISQCIHFITATFRVSHITYTAQYSHIMFLLFLFFFVFFIALIYTGFEMQLNIFY